MKAAMVLALALSTAQAAEPTGTLTLACEGTSEENTDSDLGPIIIWTNLIIDFSDRTVKGIGTSEAKITSVTEKSISFRTPSNQPEGAVNGRLDRVTGNLEATLSWHRYTNHPLIVTSFWMQCKPK
jgi:hypothetical protein